MCVHSTSSKFDSHPLYLVKLSSHVQQCAFLAALFQQHCFPSFQTLQGISIFKQRSYALCFLTNTQTLQAVCSIRVFEIFKQSSCAHCMVYFVLLMFCSLFLQKRVDIREKYPHKTLYDEDEKLAQQLLIDSVEKPSAKSYDQYL